MRAPPEPAIVATPAATVTPAAATVLSPLDGAMLGLALVSVGLLGWDWLGAPDADLHRWIVGFDLGICAIFAAEFLWRWRRAGWGGRFVLRNWTDVLGMIPVAMPALRAFRLFRVLRLLVVLARVGRVADRGIAAGTSSRLLDRLSRPLLDALRGSITLVVLDEVVEVLAQGTYTRNVVRAFDENETALRALIAEKLRQNPQAGRLAKLPFYSEIVDSVVDAGLVLTREILADPRTDELVADVLRENVRQLREAVRQRQQARQAR